MGKALPNTSAAGLQSRISQIDRVTGVSSFVALLGSRAKRNGSRVIHLNHHAMTEAVRDDGVGDLVADFVGVSAGHLFARKYHTLAPFVCTGGGKDESTARPKRKEPEDCSSALVLILASIIIAHPKVKNSEKVVQSFLKIEPTIYTLALEPILSWLFD